jgi:short-subunit dehydrogenase involved in D-alanine esterification of teichoic acids
MVGTPVRIQEVMPPLTDTPNTKSYRSKKARAEDVAAAILSGFVTDTPEIHIGIVKALRWLSHTAPNLAARVVTSSGQ